MARNPALDLAKGVALVAMASYHFTFDLAMFGHIAPDTPVTGAWAVYARAIAASFLFMAGISLWLAHQGDIRWPVVAKRTLRLAAAAAAVSIATYLAMPQAFVFYGILHAMALTGLIGLALLRLPALALLALAAAVWAAPFYWTNAAFDSRWLAWIGFSATVPWSMDFVPLFPWFAPVAAGMAAAKFGAGRWAVPALPPLRIIRALVWAGRHSLAFYLLHQPLLLAVVWAATQLLIAFLRP